MYLCTTLGNKYVEIEGAVYKPIIYVEGRLRDFWDSFNELILYFGVLHSNVYEYSLALWCHGVVNEWSARLNLHGTRFNWLRTVTNISPHTSISFVDSSVA